MVAVQWLVNKGNLCEKAPSVGVRLKAEPQRERPVPLSNDDANHYTYSNKPVSGNPLKRPSRRHRYIMSPDSLYDEAIELQQAGKLEEAVKRLEELARSQPEFPLAHAALSAFYSKQGRHGEAVQQAQLVCDLDPDDPFSHMAKSLVCQRAGMIREAEEAMADAQNRQWAAKRG
jgi:predicted Zn-dependent protease